MVSQSNRARRLQLSVVGLEVFEAARRQVPNTIGFSNPNAVWLINDHANARDRHAINLSRQAADSVGPDSKQQLKIFSAMQRQ
jgi:hypothetical protein